MSNVESDAVAAESILWDAVIVGTGMGGGTLGYALAKAGRRVLFLEKGKSTLEESADITRGRLPEDLGAETHRADDESSQSVLARTGRSGDEIEDVSGAKPTSFVPYIGSGTGGSSALYGMALERFFRSDFTPRQNIRDAGASTAPEAWPISYDELTPWYAAAEKMFHVSGTPDPLRPEDASDHLRPPPPFDGPDAELFHDLKCRGMHPYRLHMACEHAPQCSTCPGYLCPQFCRNDSATRCVRPAVTEHGATLLTECRVERLEADATCIREVHARWRDRPLRIRGKVVALAPGGLVSPTILLQSTSVEWPHGLGNQHDQVGRNLMKHVIGLYAVRQAAPRPATAPFTSFGFNDLYQVDGWKLGNVQVVGLPAIGLALSSPRPLMRLLRRMRPWIDTVWEQRSRRLVGLGTILEDLPYRDNRVLPARTFDPGRQRMQITYRAGESERNRAREFQRRIGEVLRPNRFLFLPQDGDNRLITHVCGTCRFGDDPRASVLDRNNRVHDVSNLYVVDASFFPSSAGINPSLTIAANALRVANAIDATLTASGSSP